MYVAVSKHSHHCDINVTVTVHNAVVAIYSTYCCHCVSMFDMYMHDIARNVATSKKPLYCGVNVHNAASSICCYRCL